MNIYQTPAHFNRFSTSIDYNLVPEALVLVKDSLPHPLCAIAAEQLQQYLSNQKDWNHNFGLTNNQDSAVIGKMFGVLVVETPAKELGFLAAFSGKLANTNNHTNFVPPIFDLLAEGGFLNNGMVELSQISKTIKSLSEQNDKESRAEADALKIKRKAHSVALQNKIFDQYHLLNTKGESKSLVNLFSDAGYKNPPAGAGECAGPKLLQYAFMHQLKPLALAEFWWGLSPKSATWKHKAFYACCKEKCEPILTHMLANISIAQ